jgi:glycine/D-amino acid oxidase-like deaminating enzyme
MDYLVVGGTCQKYDWNQEISEDDTEEILHGICQVFPALRGAEVVRISAVDNCIPAIEMF